MQEIVSIVEQWQSESKKFVVATVLRTIGSAPQPPGTQMLIREDLQVVGAVSGGCVESAVVEIAQQVLRTGHPVVVSFGVEDETAWGVGLSCGGTIRVLVAPHPATDPQTQPVWQAFREMVAAHQGGVWVVRLPNAQQQVSYGLWSPQKGWMVQMPDCCDVLAETILKKQYQKRKSGIVEVQGEEFFLDVFLPPAQLLIIGAGFPAFDLIVFAQRLGMRTILIDPRRVFADPRRFPVPPDQLICRWPSEVLPEMEITEETYAVILSHDPKIDDEALEYLLRSPARYIGALGSRKTHQKRLGRLRQKGFTEEALSRIAAPIGLNIGAVTPPEIAVSIIAEVVSAKYDARG